MLDELQSNSPNSEETSKELVTEVTDGSLMLQVSLSLREQSKTDTETDTRNVS